jgi:hypothetical protein
MGLIEYISSIGGIAGVLVAVMWRLVNSQTSQIKDLVVQMRQDRKFMEDRLTAVLGSYNSAIKERNQVQMAHTEVLRELTTWLKARNGHK